MPSWKGDADEEEYEDPAGENDDDHDVTMVLISLMMLMRRRISSMIRMITLMVMMIAGPTLSGFTSGRSSCFSPPTCSSSSPSSLWSASSSSRHPHRGQLSSIIIIKVVTKLRATGERGEPADHQNWKAAKALLVRHRHDDADYQNGVNDVPINVLYYDHDNNHDTNPR